MCLTTFPNTKEQSWKCDAQWRLPLSKLIDGITVSTADDSHEAKIIWIYISHKAVILKFTRSREQDRTIPFHSQWEYLIDTTLPNTISNVFPHNYSPALCGTAILKLCLAYNFINLRQNTDDDILWLASYLTHIVMFRSVAGSMSSPPSTCQVMSGSLSSPVSACQVMSTPPSTLQVMSPSSSVLSSPSSTGITHCTVSDS